METRPFGRRSLDPASLRPAARSLGFTDVPAPSTAAAEAALPPGDMSMAQALDLLPVLTLTIAAVLAAIFALENRLAFDLGADSQISQESLMAFGAVGRDLVVGAGDWWRLFTAPLLHGDLGHLGGNLFALLIVGVRLEGLIGRGWLAAIFAFSALTGEIGSLLGNPPHIVTVGASGAIVGVVAALFVTSFARRADPATERSLRRTSLFFGVPAIAPLAFGAAGAVDYFAHLGGAIGGIALGLVMLATWRPGAVKPAGGESAARLAGAALVVAVGSALIGAIDYTAWAAEASRRIPQAEIPERVDRSTLAVARDLVRRWPEDPRGHIVLGAAHLVEERPIEAEREFRAVLAMTPPDAAHSFQRSAISTARAYLALALVAQHRVAEARLHADELCDRRSPVAAQFRELRRLLVKEKVCR